MFIKPLCRTLHTSPADTIIPQLLDYVLPIACLYDMQAAGVPLLQAHPSCRRKIVLGLPSLGLPDFIGLLSMGANAAVAALCLAGHLLSLCCVSPSVLRLNTSPKFQPLPSFDPLPPHLGGYQLRVVAPPFVHLVAVIDPPPPKSAVPSKHCYGATGHSQDTNIAAQVMRRASAFLSSIIDLHTGGKWQSTV